MSATTAETVGNTARYLKISIRDPIKSTDTFGQYVCYNVESSSNIPGFVYGEVSVIRRYSDFAWLAEQLSKACPGAIIPALPEKQAVGRFQADFVETRRRALERFLLRVAAHVELNVIPAFIAFLQANDASLKTMKNQAMEKKVTHSAFTIATLHVRFFLILPLTHLPPLIRLGIQLGLFCYLMVRR